eukprot:13683189-Ditylum_brightwellii.AAC.1
MAFLLALFCTTPVLGGEGHRLILHIDKGNATYLFCEHFSCIFNNQNHLPCDLTSLDLICPCTNFTHHAAVPPFLKLPLPSTAWRMAKHPARLASPVMH